MPAIDKLNECSKNTYTRDLIIKMEAVILQALGWCLGQATQLTPLHFLDHFAPHQFVILPFRHFIDEPTQTVNAIRRAVGLAPGEAFKEAPSARVPPAVVWPLRGNAESRALRLSATNAGLLGNSADFELVGRGPILENSRMIAWKCVMLRPGPSCPEAKWMRERTCFKSRS